MNGGNSGGSAAGERVKDDMAGVARRSRDIFKKFDGFLRGVKFTLLASELPNRRLAMFVKNRLWLATEHTKFNPRQPEFFAVHRRGVGLFPYAYTYRKRRGLYHLSKT